MTRRLARVLLGVLAAIALVVPGYLFACWVGSSIPRNSGWSEPAEGVDIMVETNGTHTGIVVPIVTAQIDWRTVFPNAADPRPSGEYPTHIAIGYGEREVFLDVPTWGDLRAITALRIATVGGGESVIRVSPYVRPAPAQNYRPLTIGRDQYARLVAAILRELPPAPEGGRDILRGTYVDDGYYEARGGYTMVNTCNSWVGARLADAGIPMGAWTPMAGGVMKWIPQPEPSFLSPGGA